MPVGRPTEYKSDTVEKARRYIANHEDFDDPVPTVAGLACVLGITRETCYAWARDENKPEFSDILSELMQKQERELVKGGLLSGFNASIAKMMMTKHGYSDKIEQDNTSSDGSMTPRIDVSKIPSEALEALVNAAQTDADD